MNQKKFKKEFDFRIIDNYESFYNKYFWPVTNNFSKTFLKNLVREISRLVHKEESYLGLSIKIFHKWFLLEIIGWFYATCLKENFASNKIQPKFGKEFEKFNMLQQQKIYKNNIFKTFYNHKSNFKMIPVWIKELILNLRKNKLKISESKYCFFPSELCYDHANFKNLFLKNIHPSRLFKKLEKHELEKTISLIPQEKELIQNIFIVLKNIFLSEKQNFDPLIKKYMLIWLKISRNYFVLSYKNLKKKRLPKEIWFGSISSNIHSSLLAYTALKKNVKTVAHDHGNGDAFHEQFANNLFEYNFCSHYFSYNSNQAKIKSQSLVKDLKFNISKNQPKFIFNENKQSNKQVTIKKRIKNIMYLSTVLHAERMRFRPVIQDYQYCDWQIRLLKFLSKENRVYYKPHPERFQINMNFLKNKNLNIIQKQNFEDLKYKVDCYVIDFISSSTTKLVLESNAIVIFFDTGYLKLSSKAYTLLKKRCYIIKLSEDKLNRLKTDWKNLETVLKKKEHKFSYEFYNFYFS